MTYGRSETIDSLPLQRSLILRQLNRRFGALPDDVQQSIAALPLAEIENLAEALLDFTTLTDLQTWLAQQQS